MRVPPAVRNVPARRESFPLLLQTPGGHFHGEQNTRICAAAADISLHGVDDLRARGSPVAAQQRYARQDHSRSAVSALHRANLEERLLQRVQPSVVLQALDGCDLPARGSANRGDARPRRGAVDEYSASAALALAATVFASREIEIVAQNAEQASLRVGVDF